MREVLLFSVLGSFAAVAGCGYGYEARSTTITGAPMNTTAGEPELSRTASALSERMASEIDMHENRCGRAKSPGCMDATVTKARAELLGWNCDPAATRARAEECLASIRTASCEADLTIRETVCPINVACPDETAGLIAPGPELADIWR